MSQVHLLLEREEWDATVSLLQHLTTCHQLSFTQLCNYRQVYLCRTCHCRWYVRAGRVDSQRWSLLLFFYFIWGHRVTWCIHAICHSHTRSFKENFVVCCALCFLFLLHSVARAKCPVFFHPQSFHILACCKSGQDLHFTGIILLYRRVAPPLTILTDAFTCVVHSFALAIWRESLLSARVITPTKWSKRMKWHVFLQWSHGQPFFSFFVVHTIAAYSPREK